MRHANPSILLGALAPVFCAGLAFAALPPEFQQERERQSVRQQAESVLSEPIERVERVAEDRYLVRTRSCRLDAYIRNPPPGSAPPPPGPRPYLVELGPRRCD